MKGAGNTLTGRRDTPIISNMFFGTSLLLILLIAFPSPVISTVSSPPIEDLSAQEGRSADLQYGDMSYQSRKHLTPTEIRPWVATDGGLKSAKNGRAQH